MSGQFRIASEITPAPAPWGSMRWTSHPPSTGARQLTVLDATLAPGEAHSFHKHRDQEEVLYVIAGQIEQWLDREKRILGAGDAAFIPAGMVHGTFNAGDEDAHLLVIFGPCVGDGFEAIDVSQEAPWKGIRN